MSIAPLLTKCLTCWKDWPGQPERLGQIVKTASSGLTTGVPQIGHSLGGMTRRAPSPSADRSVAAASHSPHRGSLTLRGGRILSPLLRMGPRPCDVLTPPRASMRRHFVKMHGLGNDFAIFDMHVLRD